MSDQHPTCPKCTGLLKYEPADILGPERVKCILCGWEKARASAPAAKRVPVPGKPAPVLKVAVAEPFPKFGTCPLCKRPGMNLKHGGHCGRCAYRLANGIDLTLPNQKPGIMASRVWPHTVIVTAAARPEVIAEKPDTKEIAMSENTNKRGHCPSCNRDDVLMPGPKCSRCYDRIKKGKDVITGEPVAAQEAAAPSTAITPPLAPKKPVQAPANPNICTIDVVQVLDGVWSEKRAIMLSKLNESKSVCTRLALANSFVERINQLGC